ncbi:hypothetical protein [Roseofilum casamattae]|uniref:Uncharacterized protein n=1 Tax=Roseofilum casamattae BLCC-M143 TaxID=3022442 RepID=A0ABT7BYD7_9CYAN|nr:hypothetical protein [Roseofilum casamattae]MDJ1184171.1 hypothetical protein [Roseofilum casamattae BLCC-M143]
MKTSINEAQALADLELLKECEQSARELYELSIAFHNQCKEIVKETSPIQPNHIVNSNSSDT